MTGQVKEDILVRMGELGVQIKNGTLNFAPSLLKKDEFSTESKTFKLVSLDQEEYELTLPENGLGFTCCQVPVIYMIADKAGLEVEFDNGSGKSFDDINLDVDTTQKIFNRDGSVKKVTVSIQSENLR
jgi:hypothetical protein